MVSDYFPDRKISIDGKDYIYFGGTSYLGLSTTPEFQNNLINSIRKWGTSYGSSRASNVKLSIYEHAENLLAKNIGAERALALSSGTLAGQLVLEILEKSNSKFFHYPKTHPAILHKSSQPLFIDGQVNTELKSSQNDSIVITVDAILASEVNITDLDILNQISPSKKITLIIDESHSIGITGNDGWGVFKKINNDKIERKIMTASLSKAFSSVGGVIASDQDFIETLYNHPLFKGSSAMNPAYLHTLINSSAIIKAKQKQLQRNLSYLTDILPKREDLKFNSNYPVIYIGGNGIYEWLKSHRIIISSFKYPNYKTLMNRIVITANHEFDDFDFLSNRITDLPSNISP